MTVGKEPHGGISIRLILDFITIIYLELQHEKKK